MTLPEPLLLSLRDAKGFNETAFRAVHAVGAPVTAIRYHPIKQYTSGHQWSSTPIPWCTNGVYLSERPSFTNDPGFHAGAYYVQDASSMFLWHALSQLVPDHKATKVLDLCAAPGGKSTLLAAYFNSGLLVANEVIKSRCSILVENITKLGTDHVVVTNNDPAHFQSLGAYFDVMVVDAPCSGSGLFRKDPDAIAEWSEANVTLCSQRQQRILADVLPALKEGGMLIYATCSYSPEEDEQIADWLVDACQLTPMSIPIAPEWGIVETTSPQHQAPGYRFYPDQVKGEGFFIAAFRKNSYTQPSNTRFPGTNTLVLPGRNERTQLSEVMPIPDTFQLFKQGDLLKTMQQQWMDDLTVLSSHLYIRKAGVALGTFKGKDFVPAHELAQSILPLSHFQRAEVDVNTALQYLRRQDMHITAPKGWNLVCYGGLPLGWMKVLPNRVNNYYPTEWRILKL